MPEQLHVNPLLLQNFIQNQQIQQEKQQQQAIYKATTIPHKMHQQNKTLKGTPSTSSDESDVDNNCPANNSNAHYSSPKTHPPQSYLNKTTQQLQQFNQIQQLQLEQYLAQQRPSVILRSASDESLPCALNNDLFPPIGLKPCQRVRQPHFTPEQLVKFYQAQQQLNQLRLQNQSQNLNQLINQNANLGQQQQQNLNQQNLAQQKFVQNLQNVQSVQSVQSVQNLQNIPEQMRIQLLLQQRQQQFLQQQQSQQARLKQLYNHGLNYTLPRQPSVNQLQFIDHQQNQQRNHQLNRANSVPESVDNVAVMTNLLLHIEPMQQQQQRINLEEFKNQLLQNQHHLNQQINQQHINQQIKQQQHLNQQHLNQQINQQHLSNQMSNQLANQQLSNQMSNQLANQQISNQMSNQLANQQINNQLTNQNAQNPQLNTVQTTVIVNKMPDKLMKETAGSCSNNLPSSVSSSSASSSSNDASDSNGSDSSSNTKWTIG